MTGGEHSLLISNSYICRSDIPCFYYDIDTYKILNMKERKQDYLPSPMDLSSVKLPESLLQLSELIAENVHEVWAKSRMDEGWTYGEKRDDMLKTHPCLIPYNELPEEEKAYDRNTAMNTLKLVKKLGFKIEKED